MEELAIKIKICDRTYPMKVSRAEEVHVRKAAQHINAKVKDYKQQFGIVDKQDLLAMVAFDCLSTLLQWQDQAENKTATLVTQTKDMLHMIQHAMSENSCQSAS